MTIRLVGALLCGAVFVCIGVTPVATVSAYAQSQVNSPMGNGDFYPKDPKKKSLKKTSNTGERMGGGGGGKGAVQRDNEPPRGGGRDVGSGGRKAATCCSSLVPNAAGTDCVCRP